jgi:putative addiction module component (TIGR02574 family)
MNSEEIVEQALKLKAEERFTIVEKLLKSLDKSDKAVDESGAEEAERKLKAYREERVAAENWEMPEPMDLGPFKAPVEDWRLLANDPDLRSD